MCNRAIAVADESPYCRGCRLNEVIPDLSRPGALTAWRRIEHANKRLLYTLFQLHLPVESRTEKKGRTRLLVQRKRRQGGVAGPDRSRRRPHHPERREGDNPSREKLREQLGETYRTLLGPLRHEIGHYYWDVLVRDTEEIGPFRELFGDPDKDYDARSCSVTTREGPPRDGQTSFVSTYATMHPWEDWAETWAHYLHMVDTLGTARSYGLALRPPPVGTSKTPPELMVTAQRLDFDDFDDLISGRVPLTFALNSLNRAMGMADPYPFVLSDQAIKKLGFVHGVLERASA